MNQLPPTLGEATLDALLAAATAESATATSANMIEVVKKKNGMLGANKSLRGRSYTQVEDLLICKAFIAASCDCIVGV